MKALLLVVLLSAPAAAKISVTSGGTVADGSIDSTKLAANSVDSEKIVKRAVDSEKVVLGAIGKAHLTDAAVETAKLAPDAVTNAKILSFAVDSNKLGTGSVGTEKLANDAVTPAKVINNGAFTVGSISGVAANGGLGVNSTLTVTSSFTVKDVDGIALNGVGGAAAMRWFDSASGPTGGLLARFDSVTMTWDNYSNGPQLFYANDVLNFGMYPAAMGGNVSALPLTVVGSSLTVTGTGATVSINGAAGSNQLTVGETGAGNAVVNFTGLTTGAGNVLLKLEGGTSATGPNIWFTDNVNWNYGFGGCNSTAGDLCWNAGLQSSAAGTERMRLTQGGFLGIGSTQAGTLLHMSSGTLTVDGIAPKIRTGASTDPSLSSCGTTPAIVGSDLAGKVTIGSGATTSCTVTFAATYTTAPACVIAGDNTAVTYAATTSATALTITSSADMASDVISYICIGVDP